MTIPENKLYPHPGDKQIIYLKEVITKPEIRVGEYTIYHDFVNDPTEFEKNNVLYQYRLIMTVWKSVNSVPLRVEQNLCLTVRITH